MTKNCCKYKQGYVSEKSTKIYTRKDLVMMETTIYKFHTSLYIQEIQRLAFNIPYVQIMGNNQCDEYCRTEFKHNKSLQDVLY